jgi:hypothetical protein
MSADTSDMDAVGKEFLKIPAAMIPKLKAVVAKSAVVTKDAMRKDASGSKHFKQIARTINYDLDVHEFGGDAVIEAEIGPSGAGSASLSGIAYFGTSRPGGGTLRDPEEALLEEAPNFYEYAFKATEGLL